MCQTVSVVGWVLLSRCRGEYIKDRRGGDGKRVLPAEVSMPDTGHVALEPPRLPYPSPLPHPAARLRTEKKNTTWVVDDAGNLPQEVKGRMAKNALAAGSVSESQRLRVEDLMQFFK